MVTKRLGSIALALYASPAYLARRGAPADAERSPRRSMDDLSLEAAE